MKKMFNKAVLNGTTVMGDGLTYPRIPNVYTGDNEGGYQRGDMMDANAVVEMIKELTDTGKITIDELKNLINEEIQERVEGDQDQQRYTDEKIKDLIGTSPETLDTLKEIADALGEDPDFAANVWNKIAELTTKHNEDVQELQDAITSGFENIDFTPYVKKTDVVTDTTNGLMLASDKVKLDAFEEAERYEKAINLPDSVISNADILQYSSYNLSLEYTKYNLIDGSYDNIEIKIPEVNSNCAGVMTARMYNMINKMPDRIVGCDGFGPVIDVMYVDRQDYIVLKYNEYFFIDESDKERSIEIRRATDTTSGLMSYSDKVKLDSQPTIKASDATGVTDDDYVVIKKSELNSILSRLSALENKA